MHRPYAPTTTLVSDLLNAMSRFIDENPDWAERNDCLNRMMSGYTILTKMCEPDHLTDEEFSFVMDIFQTCQERNIL